MDTDRIDWTPRRRRIATVGSCMWLAYLVPVAVAVWQKPPAPAVTVAVVLGLAAFVVCYVRLVLVAMRRPFRLAAPYTMIVLVAVSLLLLIPIGSVWRYAVPYYLASVLPVHLPRRWWAVIEVVVLGLAVALSVGYGDRGGALVGYVASVAAVALLVLMFYSMLMAMVRLRVARDELARLAVAEERLRIARDLHDVLGQRLAAVALKSDLARRLVDRDPAAAVGEIDAAGRIAREALDEVRATVSGIRDTSLPGELSTARALLAAAGIECAMTTPGDVAGLPAPLAEVAGWVVREGVTNVVRHSRATATRISVVGGDPVVVEVADNGRGLAGGTPYGNGLTGLAERIDALGGTLSTARDGGWYRLRAELPAPAAAPLAGTR